MDSIPADKVLWKTQLDLQKRHGIPIEGLSIPPGIG